MLSMRETVLKSIREGFQRLKQESQLRTQELHEQVLAAVVAKDVEGARLAMLEHFAVPLTDLGEQDGQREFPAPAPSAPLLISTSRWPVLRGRVGPSWARHRSRVG